METNDLPAKATDACQELALGVEGELMLALEAFRDLRGYGSVEEAALEALRDAMFGTSRIKR